MNVRGKNLQPAHRGYRYQDILTGCVFVSCVVKGYDEVIVDRKAVEADRFDDLQVRIGERRVRMQIKSSQAVARPISANDFTAADSSLRFDRLLLTHLRGQDNESSEYRLCATWGPGS